MVDLTKYMKKELELVKPSEILAFAQYSSKIPDITKFTVGEPDFNTPEHIKEAAIAGVKANHSHYAPSNGTLGLRKADRKSTRLNSSHVSISYAVFCLKKKKNNIKIKEF